MNKKIYFLRFNGGSGGDFLTHQISQDSNFYPVTLVDTDNNTWTIDNVLSEFNLDLKNVVLQEQFNISKNILDSIDTKFSEKNLIINTHWTGPASLLKLPRMIPIKLNFTGKISYLFYSLLWIKRYINPCSKTLLEEAIRISSNRYDLQRQLEYISSRPVAYSFERQALMLGLDKSYDVIDSFFIRYQNFNLNKFDYANFDIEELYRYPKLNVAKYKSFFQMEGQLDHNLIEEYFSKNNQVFENTFNRTFESYKSDQEFLNDLRSFVIQNTPGAY
jgi:hypothetical protein